MKNTLQVQFRITIALAFFVVACGGTDPEPSSTSDPVVSESSVPRPTFDQYLLVAQQYCEGPATDKARKKILVSQSGVGTYYDRQTLADEPGTSFFYVTESCELFTRQHCTLGLDNTDECPPFHYQQLPYTRRKLSSNELATLLQAMRVLEWEQNFQSGDRFGLGIVHDTMLMVRYRDLLFAVSSGYIEPAPWEQANPDEEKWGAGDGPDRLRDVDYLLHDIAAVHALGGGFRSPMKEIVEGVEEFELGTVRLAIMEVDPNNPFVAEQTRIHPWPLSVSPDELEVVEIGRRYCYGQSNAISGSDADSLRRLVSEEVSRPTPERDEAIVVEHGERIFLFRMRETLPMEGANGLIDGVLDEWQDPERCVSRR